MIFITLILGIITFVLGWLRWYQTRSRFGQLMNQFPMIPYYPLAGHVAELSTNAEILYKQLRDSAERFNETFGTWSVNYGALHIIRCDDAEIILSNINYIKKGIIYQALEPWLGEGLILAEGTKWHQKRKLLTPTFHFNILRKFADIFGEHSIDLVNKLKEECGKKETNLIPIISHATLAAICETAMGTKLDMNDEKHTDYLKAIYGIIPIIFRIILFPLYYIPIIFHLSPLGFHLRNLLKTARNFTTNIIKVREENFKESDLDLIEDDGMTKKRLALLDLLISAKKKEVNIDTKGIREEVDTFMFAGHETTSTSMCMTLMLLAHHKDSQDKIIEELNSIFGDDDRPASFEDLTNMKYLELCIKESLRLYPSVPMIIRNIPEEIQLTRHIAPKGSEVIIYIYDVHRDPVIFPDPEKFDPNRFLPEVCKGRHPYAYIPFSAGPRNCIGQRFALLELKSFISSIFRNFTLEPVSKFDELRWAMDLVLKVNGPINVKFVPRK